MKTKKIKTIRTISLKKILQGKKERGNRGKVVWQKSKKMTKRILKNDNNSKKAESQKGK